MEWRKNLYHFEATPPDDAWENVKKELDSDVPKIRELLAEYTEQPPVPVWEAISAELDKSEETPDKSQKTPLIWYRRPSFVTSAAASIAGIVLLYTFFFSERKDFSPADVSASVYKPSIQSTPPVTSVDRDNKDSVDKPSFSLLQPATQDFVSLSQGSIHPDSRSANVSRITQADPLSMSMNQDDENYIYLVTNSGEVKRVSYKLEKMITEIRKQDGDKLRQWTEMRDLRPSRSSCFHPPV
jgi:hypothetical protein